MSIQLAEEMDAGKFPRLMLQNPEPYLSKHAFQGGHLLVDKNELLHLAGDGIHVADRRMLDENYEQIEAREEYWLATKNSPYLCLHLIERDTGKVRKNIELNDCRRLYHQIIDFVPHPHREETYVVVRKGLRETPSYAVLLVNEETADVQLTGILGTWIDINPDGRMLYSGYQDFLRPGSPNGLPPELARVAQENKSIDAVFSWRLGSRVRADRLKLQVGTGGTGIALTADFNTNGISDLRWSTRSTGPQLFDFSRAIWYPFNVIGTALFPFKLFFRPGHPIASSVADNTCRPLPNLRIYSGCLE